MCVFERKRMQVCVRVSVTERDREGKRVRMAERLGRGISKEGVKRNFFSIFLHLLIGEAKTKQSIAACYFSISY